MLICDYELLEYVGIIIALLESHCCVLKFLILMCNTLFYVNKYVYAIINVGGKLTTQLMHIYL